MRFTWYERPTIEPQGESFDLSWTEFHTFLNERWHFGPKEKAPGWAPHECQGPRKNENVKEVSFLVLDVDKKPLTDLVKVGQAVAKFRRIEHTTRSHSPDEDVNCYRIILPLKRPIPASQWKACYKGALGLLGLEGLVDELKDPARFFYVPSARDEDAERCFDVEEGEELDLSQFANSEPEKPARIPTQDTPQSPRSIDLGEVKEALKSWGGDPSKAKRALALFDGEPWAAPGARDQELTGLVGQVIGRFPELTADEVEHLFLESAHATAARDGDEPMEHWLQKARDLAERFRPGAEEFQEEKRKEKAALSAARDSLAKKLRKPALLLSDIPAPPTEGERPEILVGTDIERMVTEAEEALASDPRVFCAAGSLVRLCAGGGKPLEFVREDEDVPMIVGLDQPTLGTWLSTAARWVKESKDGVTATKPPRDVSAALMTHRVWPHMNKLSGFIETPALRPDGTLLAAPGYDTATGLYYIPSVELAPIPDEPDEDDALEALDLILEIVADFPFEDGASKAAWVAALLTPFVRPTLDGLAPMFVVDANTRGSGKTKLVDLISLICTGRLIPKMANTTDDDEMRKRLLSIALSGKNHVTFDNVKDALGTPSLDGALTAGLIEDRLLGVNRVVSAPLRCTWFATGNNVSYEGDTARRVLPIHLVSPLEKPEERDGFKHPDLAAWVLDNRPALVRACLIALRAFYVAGSPRHSAKPWGSFEAWQRIVCSCVAWLGLPDPEGTRLNIEATSELEGILAIMNLFAEVSDGRWMTVGQFLGKLSDPSKRAARAEGRAALMDACEGHGGEISAKRVGKFFHKNKNKVLGGRMLKCVQRHDKEWRLETIGIEGHPKDDEQGT